MTYDPLKHLTDSAETLHLMAQLMEHDLKHWHEIEPRDHMVLLDARAHRLREASQTISSAAKMLARPAMELCPMCEEQHTLSEFTIHEWYRSREHVPGPTTRRACYSCAARFGAHPDDDKATVVRSE